MATNKQYPSYIERNANIDPDRARIKEEARRRFIKKKKRKRLIKRILLCFMVCLAIITGNVIARIQTKVSVILNGMDRQTGIDLSDVEVDHDNLVSDKKVINILLIGADKRENWAEAGRSDSTMIATLDLKNKRLKLTSLMRDMYVNIPGYGDNKFNSAYSYGGVSLLYQTIANNFGLKLDGFVVVDFAAFRSVINTIGGVEIELTDAEHKYLTTAYKYGSVLKLKPGRNNMTGNQALAYTRIRQDANGDFGRTKRQRNVLNAVFKKAKSMPLSKLLELVEEIMPYIATDLSDKEIMSYVQSVLMMGTTEIDQFRIPIDDSFTQDRIRNMAVLIPDLAVNTRALNEFIFESDGE